MWRSRKVMSSMAMAPGSQGLQRSVLTFPFAFRRSEIKFWSPRACEDIVDVPLVVLLFSQARSCQWRFVAKKGTLRNPIDLYEMNPRAFPNRGSSLFGSFHGLLNVWSVHYPSLLARISHCKKLCTSWSFLVGKDSSHIRSS